MENKSCCSSGNSDTKVKSIKIKSKIINSNNNSIKVKKSSCCCGGNANCSEEPITKYNKNDHWIIGEIKTEAGMVPQISTHRVFKDLIGSCKVRWGINRMKYRINPGIYAVGTPDKDSIVLVTANYKLTFDALRKELSELNAWILVLDTKGINVWCAAGKGTFGTKEIINRISKVKLSEIVSHKALILPQLGAPGVSAHEVTQKTGFKIIYGPIRAGDIKKFISSGMQATDEMRKVEFNLIDRLVLTPIEFVGTLRTSIMVFGVLFLLNLFAANPFGIVDFYAYTGALIAGSVITPVLLPWIPGRAFALKGWLVGLLWTLTVIYINDGIVVSSFGYIKALGYLLVLPSVSAYYAMNFTGSSTYTSPSGVMKEMEKAIPVMAVTICLGAVLLLVNSFVKL